MALNFRSAFEKKDENSNRKSYENHAEIIEKPNLSTNEENFDPNKWRFLQPEDKQFEKKLKKKTSYHTKSLSMVNSIRGFGMSDLHSSNSLQNSVTSWTFGKANRFSSLHKKPITDSIYNLPDFKTSRATSLGKGERSSTSVAQSLPPNLYKIESCFDINKRKKKGVIIAEKLNQTSCVMRNPGPGAYNLAKEMGKDKNAILVRSRLMFYYVTSDQEFSEKKHCISPQKYLPSTRVQQNLRFTTIGFGKGERGSTENSSVKQFPGPGAYNLPTIFAKGMKKKVPMN